MSPLVYVMELKKTFDDLIELVGKRYLRIVLYVYRKKEWGSDRKQTKKCWFTFLYSRLERKERKSYPHQQ